MTKSYTRTKFNLTVTSAYASLTLCPLGNFVQEYHPSDVQIGSRTGLTFIRPDLGLNCLQRLSADDTSRQRDKGTLGGGYCSVGSDNTL